MTDETCGGKDERCGGRLSDETRGDGKITFVSIECMM